MTTTEFFEDVNDHTRATYYVLPLISLNKFSFGPPENFINAYLSKTSSKLLVKVKNSSLAYPIVFNESPLESFTDTELVFTIPGQFKRDLEMFWQGRYSQFREEAKRQIMAHAGLAVNADRLGEDGVKQKYTDARILILDRDPLIRKYLEEELRIGIDPKSELLSPPKEDEVYKEVEEPATV